MQGRSRSVLPALAGVVVLVAVPGCTDATPAALPPLAERPVLDAAPFLLNPGPAESAAFGDAVAVVNPAWNADRGDDSGEPAVAAWSPDGTWRELPEPEPVAGRRLLSTEKGLLLLGRDGRRLQLQYLGLTDAEWTELDIPDMEVTEETEFWEAVSGGVAVMGTTSGWLVADDDGEVQLFEFDSPSNRRLCVIEGRLLELRFTTTMDRPGGSTTTATPGSLSVLDPNDAEPSWERRAGAPEGVEVAGPAITCGPDGPVLLTAGGEVSYDDATDEWTTRPTQAPGVAEAMPYLSYHGILADGTTYAIDPDGEVFQRTASGEWSNTGIRGNQLVTTPTHAYVAGPDDIVTVP
jgi:hypothetical protein